MLFSLCKNIQKLVFEYLHRSDLLNILCLNIQTTGIILSVLKLNEEIIYNAMYHTAGKAFRDNPERCGFCQQTGLYRGICAGCWAVMINHVLLIQKRN
jgi:hypothetical protein